MTALFRRTKGHTADTALAFIAAMVQEFPATVVAKLSHDGKFPVQSFDTCVEQNKGVVPEVRMRWVRNWIGRGASVGLIFHRAGLWVLDLDMTGSWPKPIQDVVKQLNPPQVATPGGGHHLYFRLPDDLHHHPDLKGHLNLRTAKGVSLDVDLKLGGRRTLVVAPGSRSKAGSYRVVTPWHTPPMLDPRRLFPAAEVFHIQKQVKFAVSDRDFEDRVARGIQYLKTAKISVSKRRGGLVLRGVCVHLRIFLGLPVSVALKLLTTPMGGSWNDRCKNGVTGAPYPWSREELLRALKAAEHDIPQAGIQLYEKKRREKFRDEVLLRICMVLKCHVGVDGVAVPVREIYMLAMAITGLTREQCTATRFGTFLGRQGLSRVQKKRDRSRSLMLREGFEPMRVDLAKMFMKSLDPGYPVDLDPCE